MEATTFLNSVRRELEGADVTAGQAREAVRCVQQFLATTTRGSTAVDEQMLARLCTLSKTAPAVPARWAALSVLAVLVRAHCADEALATRLLRRRRCSAAAAALFPPCRGHR